jgi:hypothetical protein
LSFFNYHTKGPTQNKTRHIKKYKKALEEVSNMQIIVMHSAGLVSDYFSSRLKRKRKE